jgi:fructokinase
VKNSARRRSCRAKPSRARTSTLSAVVPARNYTVVGLGELLWDMLPGGKQLGGAPANFAYMTRLLGDQGVVASRVGTDALGRLAARRLERLGVRSSHLQLDAVHPTGTVTVEVDADGQPTFEIAESVAWDFLEWTPAWQTLVEEVDAVCFGSLAQRSAQARQTIRAFLQAVRPGTLRVFDVNLRQNFYSAQTLSEGATLADIIKLNSDELLAVVKTLGSPSYDETSAAQWLRRTYKTKLVCVTRGAKGSLLVGEDTTHEHPGCAVNVVDTVGSGDAFTAALVYHYLRQAPLPVLNDAANRMGAWVASQSGATPARDNSQLEKIRSVAG